MFIAALFTIAKRWKQHRCPSTDGSINKMWYIHTMEQYLALKRDKILIDATTWINLENIMFSEKKGRNKRPHLYDCIYMKRSEKASPQKQKADQ